MINIAKFFRSLRFAFAGICSLILSENNARIHLLATIGVVIFGFYFKINTSEWLWISLAVALVWASEAFNTAIEAVVDLVKPDLHPLAKKAKDLAAAGVLIVAIFAIIVALFIFGGKIIR